jgi:hypothetical protein
MMAHVLAQFVFLCELTKLGNSRPYAQAHSTSVE